MTAEITRASKSLSQCVQPKCEGVIYWYAMHMAISTTSTVHCRKKLTLPWDINYEYLQFELQHLAVLKDAMNMAGYRVTVTTEEML